jgi:hypothetical protein
MMVSKYNSEILRVIDQHAPLKSCKIVIRPETKWYNEELREAKQDRRRAERRWRKSRLSVHWQIYIAKRAFVNHLLLKSKQEFYNNLICESSTDSKRLFQIVSELLGGNKSTILPTHNSMDSILSKFSDYFIEKIQNIRNTFQQDNPLCQSSMEITSYSSVELTCLTAATCDEI